MSTIKVTVFQKNIHSEITKDQKQKLIAAKSDFLLLPEYFPSFNPQDKTTIEKSKRKELYLDKILEVSEYFKGVIIGGSIVREFEGKYYYSTPIVQNVNLIDWYDKKVHEEKDIQNGDNDGIFILSGVRFAIFCGGDLSPNTYSSQMERIQNEKIAIVLHLASNSNFANYEDDLKFYSNIAKNYNVQIIKCSGTGSHNENKLDGRSLFATKTGLNWKVAPFENDTEIIKTLTVNSA